MRNLKRFSENFESNSSDIIYTCENILLGLKDIGYRVVVEYNRGIDDADIINIHIRNSVGEIRSADIIDYIKTINDFLSIDYEYDFTAYARGNEYDFKSLEDSDVNSRIFIIYYEIK